MSPKCWVGCILEPKLVNQSIQIRSLVSYLLSVLMGGATGGCGRDNVPLTFAACTRRGYNKIKIRLHIPISLGLHVHVFPAQIDGIRSGYYHTRNALKPTYSHLRSHNFPGEKPLDSCCVPQGYHSNPPDKCLVTGLASQYRRTMVYKGIWRITQSAIHHANLIWSHAKFS